MLAGWWRRVGATIVDGLLVGVLFAIILAILGVSGFGRSFIEILAQAIYQIVMIGGNGGRTVGNRAASTVVVDTRTGAPASYERAVPRALVAIALGFTVIGGIIDILWPIWDKQNQTLHDKAAGTVVLRTDV
jgi:uncharacterized RDD family membrane protein YckC